jgi:transcriptional regulator with XRE-family HTH domain
MPAKNIHRFLASQMRALRHRHKLTQEQTATLIGCDYKYYQEIEAGSKDLKLSMLERLAKPFGLQTQQLFADPLPPTTVEEQPSAKKADRS